MNLIPHAGAELRWESGVITQKGVPAEQLVDCGGERFNGGDGAVAFAMFVGGVVIAIGHSWRRHLSVCQTTVHVGGGGLEEVMWSNRVCSDKMGRTSLLGSTKSWFIVDMRGTPTVLSGKSQEYHVALVICESVGLWW